MNNKTIIAVLAAACMSSGAVFAQDEHRDQRDEHKEKAQASHVEEHGYEEGRRNDRQDYRPVAPRDEHGPRGAGPRHDMRKGGRLADEYRGKQYVVDDWRGHHLSAPPRGMHWVQTGGDYVLVAVATGIIADILLNN